MGLRSLSFRGTPLYGYVAFSHRYITRALRSAMLITMKRNSHIRVTGIVVDSETDVPLAEVTIRVTDTQVRVTTDETGCVFAGLTGG